MNEFFYTLPSSVWTLKEKGMLLNVKTFCYLPSYGCYHERTFNRFNEPYTILLISRHCAVF